MKPFEEKRMESTIWKLSEFTERIEYEVIPKQISEFTKKTLLDTFGCGIAGMASDKGKWGIDFGRRCFSGKEEATVLGYGDRLSLMGASFVNAELINGLDYEAAGLHLPPFVVPPILALAERYHCSGREFITAVAAALEIGTRIAKGLVQKKAERGEGIAPVFGPCSSVFGGAAGAAKICGLNKEKTAEAIGLSGVLSPVPSQASMHKDIPVNSGKYLMAGWAAQTGLTAVELIKSGHRGNTAVLDSEYGYWKFTGCERWEPETVLEGLGEQWEFLEATPYKRFPCCGMMHGGLECLKALLEEEKLLPDEIEEIKVFLDPSSAEPMFHNRIIENQMDAQFSVAYNMAVTALRIPSGICWQDCNLFHSPKVMQMMEKVTAYVHPGCGEVQKRDKRCRIVSVHIKARGKTFSKEFQYKKGVITAGSATEVTDEERIRKFEENTSMFLPKYKVEAAVKTVMNLEQVQDMQNLMDVLHV